MSEDKVCPTHQSAEKYCRVSRGDFAALERELADIPRKIEAAKVAADAASIIALKDRQRALLGELLTAVAAKREQLDAFTNKRRGEVDRVYSAAAARLAAEEGALAKLKADYAAEVEWREALIVEAAKEFRAVEQDVQGGGQTLFDFRRELSNRIDELAAAL